MIEVWLGLNHSRVVCLGFYLTRVCGIAIPTELEGSDRGKSSRDKLPGWNWPSHRWHAKTLTASFPSTEWTFLSASVAEEHFLKSYSRHWLIFSKVTFWAKFTQSDIKLQKKKKTLERNNKFEPPALALKNHKYLYQIISITWLEDFQQLSKPK